MNQPRRRRWQGAQLMPGAGRLLFHLHHAGVPVALATSTPRATMERKLAAPAAQGLRCIFQARAPLPSRGSWLWSWRKPGELRLPEFPSTFPRIIHASGMSSR